MGRALAVDWGSRRIGVAISDETRTIARPLPAITDLDESQVLSVIAEVVRTEAVDTVVVGHPIHMSGRAGLSADAAGHLASLLAERLPGTRVVLWDERLTSKEAASILHEKGERIRRASGRLDQVAAAVLLQAFLNSEVP